MANPAYTIDYTRPATHVAQLKEARDLDFKAVPLLVAAWKHLVEIEMRQKSMTTGHPEFLLLQNQRSFFEAIILTYPANTIEEASVKLKYLYFMIAEVNFDATDMDRDIDPSELADEDPNIAALALLSSNLRHLAA